jgi:two-component system chemotaxis response regulator CheY
MIKRKVLVVDDSNLMVSVIRKFITTDFNDIDVIEAHSGEECLKKFESEHPDLVFLDIIMPGMDGITALEKIRQQNPRAKVVMCTSMKETEQEARAKAAGCVGYITKPFSKSDISAAIKKHLG